MKFSGGIEGRSSTLGSPLEKVFDRWTRQRVKHLEEVRIVRPSRDSSCRSGDQKMLLTRILTGCHSGMFIIPRAARVWLWLMNNAFASIVSMPCDFVVTRRWYRAFGRSTICLAALSTLKGVLFCSSRFTVLSGSWNTLLAIWILWVKFVCANIATGCDYQGTTLHFDRRIPRMRQLTNAILRKMSTTIDRATLNQAYVLCSLRRRRRRINFSRSSCGLVVVSLLGTFWRFMWFAQLGGIIEEWIRFVSPAVSRRQSAVCMKETEVLWLTQSLYVCLAVGAISVDSFGNSSRSNNDIRTSEIRTRLQNVSCITIWKRYNSRRSDVSCYWEGNLLGLFSSFLRPVSRAASANCSFVVRA